MSWHFHAGQKSTADSLQAWHVVRRRVLHEVMKLDTCDHHL